MVINEQEADRRVHDTPSQGEPSAVLRAGEIQQADYSRYDSTRELDAFRAPARPDKAMAILTRRHWTKGVTHSMPNGADPALPHRGAVSSQTVD